MKILYFITKSNFGGAQRYVYDLSRLAKIAGHDVSVAGGVNIKKDHGNLEEKLEAEEIRFIPVQNLTRDLSIGSDVKGFFEIFEIIKKEKPDVVHFNSSKMGMGILASRVLKIFLKYPKRIVFTAHGWPFNEERPYYELLLIKFVSWLSVVLSDITITVAIFDYNKGIEMPAVEDKICYIHNGIEKIELLKKDIAREELEKTGLIKFDDNFTYVTVAELTNNKGLGYLIEAVDALRYLPVRFVIIGEGELKDELEKEIIEKKLEAKFILLGRLEKVETYLKAFDGFILPSIKEGLPYVLLEAGRAGLPVIATSVGGVPEIIEDMKTGILVRKKDPDEIIRAVNYVLQNKENSDNFGKELKAKIANDFNWGKMAKETFRAYKEA